MRYTHKLDKPEGNCNYFLIPDQEQCDAAENKLGQLEDIEEELGIELTTLILVQRIGAYFKGKETIWKPLVDFDDKCFIVMETEIYRYYFRDYGKTWALTKEGLK